MEFSFVLVAEVPEYLKLDSWIRLYDFCFQYICDETGTGDVAAQYHSFIAVFECVVFYDYILCSIWNIWNLDCLVWIFHLCSKLSWYFLWPGNMMICVTSSAYFSFSLWALGLARSLVYRFWKELLTDTPCGTPLVIKGNAGFMKSSCGTCHMASSFLPLSRTTTTAICSSSNLLVATFTQHLASHPTSWPLLTTSLPLPSPLIVTSHPDQKGLMPLLALLLISIRDALLTTYALLPSHLSLDSHHEYLKLSYSSFWTLKIFIAEMEF